MIQVVRALKDAEVCSSITTSQLDLLLTKINLATTKKTSPVRHHLLLYCFQIPAKTLFSVWMYVLAGIL
jgi:hypothetical protein